MVMDKYPMKNLEEHGIFIKALNGNLSLLICNLVVTTCDRRVDTDEVAAAATDGR